MIGDRRGARNPEGEHASGKAAFRAQGVFDGFHKCWRFRSWCWRRWLIERRLRLRQRSVERLRQLNGLSVSHVMHVDDTRGFIQNMIVDGGDVESRSAQLLHDRREFVLQENQVAHDHGFVVVPSERRPGAECQSWLNLDAGNRDMKIRAGKAQPVDIAGLLSRAAHRFVNFGRIQALGHEHHGTGQQKRKNQHS